LDDGDGPVQAEAALVEAGELAEAQAGAEQGDDVVPPPQREVGEEQPGLVGGEGAAACLAEQRVGSIGFGGAGPCAWRWRGWRLRPLQALLGGGVARLSLGVDGLGALGAVIEPPGDLVPPLGRLR
jgi:hypothetical protein